MNACAAAQSNVSIHCLLQQSYRYTRLLSDNYYMGPSIKYVTLFLANFYPPPPVTLCHTFRDPQNNVTHLEPPRSFSRPVRFCAGWFLSILLLSQYNCYKRKLDIT